MVKINGTLSPGTRAPENLHNSIVMYCIVVFNEISTSDSRHTSIAFSASTSSEISITFPTDKLIDISTAFIFDISTAFLLSVCALSRSNYLDNQFIVLVIFPVKCQTNFLVPASQNVRIMYCGINALTEIKFFKGLSCSLQFWPIPTVLLRIVIDSKHKYFHSLENSIVYNCISIVYVKICVNLTSREYDMSDTRLAGHWSWLIMQKTS